jgi:adenine-specific DNA-methyltransferase
MTASRSQRSPRYSEMDETKVNGATYTPGRLADFVAAQMMSVVDLSTRLEPVRVLDPAAGDGGLLLVLLAQLRTAYPKLPLHVYGFETNPLAVTFCADRIENAFPGTETKIAQENFLDYVVDGFAPNGQKALWNSAVPLKYDLIIANPPYVRTQVMGALKAQRLAGQFGLSGRVDLYHAFLIAISRVLEPTGVAGIIVSNRFMTTRSGGPIRAELSRAFRLHHIWDLGDTRLFKAAVLPAVLIAKGQGENLRTPALFSSIYETDRKPTYGAQYPLQALSFTGVVGLSDGRRFEVTHGRLESRSTSDAVWTISNNLTDAWLGTVRAYTWRTFRDIGKIRVGVKTCADSVFIRSDWDDMPAEQRPELLRPLMTHHVARRFQAKPAERQRLILYPHEVKSGQREAAVLDAFPRSRAYLESHRSALEQRKYLSEAGRAWYEIWVPQDPNGWSHPKLVFRDISKAPTFWLDKDGSVVNGDCYWMALNQTLDEDLLWLALAVANSSFIEKFYDLSFHNKLYAGRRRFITQYVERFPLPDPTTPSSRAILAKAKQVYEVVDEPESSTLEEELDTMVWSAFGLSREEIRR